MKFLAALALSLFLFGCSKPEPSAPVNQPTNEPAFRNDGTLQFLTSDAEVISEVAIEIAETDESRELGLMYRTSMESDHAMLFIFDRSEPRRFWMANTYISLDLLFVDENLEVVRIARYARPHSQSGIDSPEPAMYVVEVVGGYADTHGLIEGNKISFARNSGTESSDSETISE